MVETRKVVALRDHVYNSRPVKAGSEYDAEAKDLPFLAEVRFARLVPDKPVPAPKPKEVEIRNVSLKAEEPEEPKEEPVLKPDLKPRKRRRYKRSDMKAEKG